MTRSTNEQERKETEKFLRQSRAALPVAGGFLLVGLAIGYFAPLDSPWAKAGVVLLFGFTFFGDVINILYLTRKLRQMERQPEEPNNSMVQSR